MMRKTVTGFALAAGCAIALAVSAAQAQTYDNWHGNAAVNNRESSRYDGLLEMNPAFRQERARRECGPITIAHLRMGCLDSFGLTEDDFSRGRSDGLTGGGDGRMNPIDRTFQGPEKYDPRFGR